MTAMPPLDLNLATRPLRNRRLYKALVYGLVLVIAVLVGLSAFVFLKYGGEAGRLKEAAAAAKATQDQARAEQRLLSANIRKAESAGRQRVELVNGIILKKTFLWTALFSELEQALPGPSYLTALTPNFLADGSVAMHIRVTSRSLEEFMTFIDNLAARGFKNIQVGDETRSDEGRLIMEIDLRYERAL
jgi:Tfp pilus assembly protein PilN